MASKEQGNDLLTLKTIAETLNQSQDLNEMLTTVLERLLEVTGLAAGWIFLSENKGDYICAADCHLPPALKSDNKKPMKEGGCWCIDKYWSGKLTGAVNIMECKRLEDAVTLSLGDTKDITHHATVPLKAGKETFGLLNVASPGKIHFNVEELALLESVAYQIGTAIKRMKLYEAHQKRAVDFAKLDVATRQLKKLNNIATFSQAAADYIKAAFQFDDVTVYIKDNGRLSNKKSQDDSSDPETHFTFAAKADREKSVVLTERQNRFIAALPLNNGEKVIGVLVISTSASRQVSEEILKALADHLSLAMENAKLHKMRQELSVLEERNRLARDLHDSVSQTLFSLSLTTKGAKNLSGNDAQLEAALEGIQQMAHTALSEMRTLIWQLRPPGLEEGVVTALNKYGRNLGLIVHTRMDGVASLPEKTEETIWRIGQECLNNVLKHAKTDEAEVTLAMTGKKATLTVKDNGTGFFPEDTAGSIGLASMKERAKAAGGEFKVISKIGKGTEVTVTLPVKGGFDEN
ncbi:GAF domain-containing sensor histidine kinase [Salipaludibacillus aurantiacus]|uniref:Oxygen sensor histidine kinase NreB n=1 Tax=Salipaludibacillus aurantiacus TaxID=1601833 RepID=A0A1H9Q987_9BACI|nr:GAF domain-containing sensor histidine kinase [Salipaludibacillus aurantiacus]SER56968.1 hypothetical protein SAMN05518684_10295 [Salipaludibacillus aurantiacus]